MAGAAAPEFEYGDDASQTQLDRAWRGKLRELAAATPSMPAWKTWGLYAGVLLAAVCLVAGGWMVFAPSRAEPLPSPSPFVESPTVESSQPELSTAVTQPAAPARVPLDPRWLPSAAQSVLSLSPGALERQGGARIILGHTASLWNPALATLLAAFPFTPAEIRRLTWSSTDLAGDDGNGWLAAGLVILELEGPVAQRKEWLDGCKTLEAKLGPVALRTVPASPWPHPFAVVDERTIVTGPAAILDALDERGGPREAQTDLDRLVDSLDSSGELIWALDLATLRALDAVPAWLPLVEMWHAGHDDWQVVRELPRAVGLGLRLDERLQMELLLACDGESSAVHLEQALGRVVSAVEKTMSGETEGLTRKLLAGEITTADAGQLKLLFSATRDALARREFERDGATVRLVADWHDDWSAVALAAVASVPELESRRLAAARLLDEDHQGQLLEALAGFTKAELSFPAGAGGAALFPPEDRLSWIATLLPYYDRLDWHGELGFGRPWNEATNARVTRRPLDLVVNPALGPSQTKAGFPVTHYVGLAGLGADAGKLGADDPRAGVFGYNRRTTREQIADGASHTMALMGVSQKLGAWAAGGAATVRPLISKPYVNGPDGFGSGQPKGMLVGMADGSVRFISKDIDPAVLERMATINGGESAGPVDPVPQRAVDAAEMAESKAEDGAEPEEEIDVEKPAADVVEVRPAVRAGPAKPDVEVQARLADRIPAIEFDKVPLSEVVRMLSEFSTLKINIDVEALAEMGIKPDVKVTLRLEDATVDEVLAAALAEHTLAHVVADGQVLVTNPHRLEETLQSRRFNIVDLAGDDPSAAEELAALVRRLVQPAAWQESGGRGSVRVAKGALEVKQTSGVEQQLAQFLDKLRLARGRPVALDGRPAEDLTLDTRYALARPRLELPITVNFSEPTTLVKIAGQLEKAAEVKIVFDGLSLTEAGVSSQVKAKLSLDRRPLAEGLTALLEPIGLAFRAVNARTIQVTTRKAAGERMELEFHRVGDLVGDRHTPDELRQRMLDELGGETWSESGGAGVMYYDVASKCLIVLQSQAVQIELERMLEGLRAAK